jgi:hypothetical protein
MVLDSVLFFVMRKSLAGRDFGFKVDVWTFEDGELMPSLEGVLDLEFMIINFMPLIIKYYRMEALIAAHSFSWFNP